MLERIKTALVLVFIVAICLFASSEPYLMIMLVTVGGIISALEWANLIPGLANRFLFIIPVVIANFCALMFPSLLPAIWIFSLAIWLVSFYWVKRYPHGTSQWFEASLLFYIGLVLITATMSSMFYLWQQSPWWLLYAMFLVWCADTGAYFAGRSFGKNKLAPNVSPKKTMEGLIGGLLLCLVVIFITKTTVIGVKPEHNLSFILLSVLAAGISVQGDLLESMIKRKAGVKDSGTILPGHGGLLDRIDSMMATLPLFALGYMMFNF